MKISTDNRATNHSAHFPLLLLLATLSLITSACGQLNQIDQDELIFKMNQETKPLLLDVRTAGEYMQGHIPGSVNISHVEIQKRLPEISRFRGGEVVVYCRTGRRAGLVIPFLTNSGFVSVVHLEGDMPLWIRNGRPVETGPGAPVPPQKGVEPDSARLPGKGN